MKNKSLWVRDVSFKQELRRIPDSLEPIANDLRNYAKSERKTRKIKKEMGRFLGRIQKELVAKKDIEGLLDVAEVLSAIGQFDAHYFYEAAIRLNKKNEN